MIKHEDRECHMPFPICLGIDNYAHAQTVDTRPFFLGRVEPGNEAKDVATVCVDCMVRTPPIILP